MIDRDSVELRRIVLYAIKLASQTDWDQVEFADGEDGKEKLAVEYAEQAIREAK